MRIKKVSQTSGYVGTVSNSYSESTTDTYSCDYVNDLNTYSTTETRIGTWIDGKPLYRKIIETTITGTTQMVIPHGISNLAWMTRCDVTMFNQYNYFMANGKDINDISVDSGNIYFTSAWPTGNAKIILEYTKTTD